MHGLLLVCQCHRGCQRLQKQLHFFVKVFESMKGYKLQGSGVALHPNAQHALEAIQPDLLAR